MYVRNSVSAWNYGSFKTSNAFRVFTYTKENTTYMQTIIQYDTSYRVYSEYFR